MTLKLSQLNFTTLNGKYESRGQRKVFLYPNRPFENSQRREYGMLLVRALKGVLKLRYIVLGGALGGGVTLKKVTIKSVVLYVMELIMYML